MLCDCDMGHVSVGAGVSAPALQPCAPLSVGIVLRSISLLLLL